jgi:hypothetical protein
VFTDALLRNEFFCCCVLVLFCGNVFTEPLPGYELVRLPSVMPYYVIKSEMRRFVMTLPLLFTLHATITSNFLLLPGIKYYLVCSGVREPGTENIWTEER